MENNIKRVPLDFYHSSFINGILQKVLFKNEDENFLRLALRGELWKKREIKRDKKHFTKSMTEKCDIT